jgi:hypothetical protein
MQGDDAMQTGGIPCKRPLILETPDVRKRYSRGITKDTRHFLE